MNPAQVLVTGGTGVLGRRVVERLCSEGIRARVFSRSGKPGTIRGDLLTGEGLRPAVQGIETIRKYPALDGLLVPLVHRLRGNKTMHVELTPAKAPSQNGA